MAIKRDALWLQVKDKKRIGFYGFVVVVLAIVARMLPGSDAAHGALIGGIFGLAGHWRATCWARTEISDTSLSLREVQSWLHGIGYLDVPGTNVLKPNFPEWLCFEAQTITLEHGSGKTKVRGAYYVLKRLARRTGQGTVAA